jgi:type I restriction enzyme, S subunit
MQDLLTRGIDEQNNIRNEATHTFEVKNGIKVPVEWEVKPASELIHIINGGTPKTNVKEYWENGTIPWLSVEDFNNGRRYVTGSIKHITKEGLNKSATKLLPRNALIISARGTVGVISQLGIEMTFNQSCYGLISKNESIISNDYLYYALKQVFNSGSVSKSGSVFDTITKITFDEIKICYPSNPDEFHKITSILGKHDLFLEQQQTNLAKLQSLKTGLMQDLLSRKVRVPEEVKEELF